MIKPEELRVGNAIIYKEFGEGEGKIGFIKAGDIGRVKYNEDEYLPIPLTPKWLKKMGFNTRPERRFYIFHNERVLFEYWLLDGSIVIEGGFLPTKIQYVHQLQNLYFALTGEELTIK